MARRGIRRNQRRGASAETQHKQIPLRVNMKTILHPKRNFFCSQTALRQFRACIVSLLLLRSWLFSDSAARAQNPGSLDPSFNPGAGATGGPVLCNAVYTDGYTNILIGGGFRFYN